MHFSTPNMMLIPLLIRNTRRNFSPFFDIFLFIRLFLSMPSPRSLGHCKNGWTNPKCYSQHCRWPHRICTVRAVLAKVGNHHRIRQKSLQLFITSLFVKSSHKTPITIFQKCQQGAEKGLESKLWMFLKAFYVANPLVLHQNYYIIHSPYEYAVDVNNYRQNLE